MPPQPDDIDEEPGLQVREADLDPARPRAHGIVTTWRGLVRPSSTSRLSASRLDDGAGHPADVGPDPVGHVAPGPVQPDHHVIPGCSPAGSNGPPRQAVASAVSVSRVSLAPFPINSTCGLTSRTVPGDGPGQLPGHGEPGGLRARAGIVLGPGHRGLQPPAP